MGNDPHQVFFTRQFLQDLDGPLPGRIVQGPESLVYEHGLKVHGPGRVLHDVRKAQRHGKRRHEGLAAGQGLHIPDRVIDQVIDIQIEPGLSLASQRPDIPALEDEFIGRHAGEPPVRRLDDLAEIPALHVCLKVQLGTAA